VCWALREAATSLVGNALAKRDGAEAADVVDASLTMALVLGSALAWAIHTHASLLIGVSAHQPKINGRLLEAVD